MMQTPSRNELLAWLRLSLQPGLNRATARSLLAEFGLPQHIFATSAALLARHMPRDLANCLLAPPPSEVQQTIDVAMEMLAQPGHHLVTLADSAYPRQLLDGSDPPLLLYVRGDPACLHKPSVAIVGARSATEGGKDNARAFARHLAERGWTVVSGLARGIDAAAHEGALQSGVPGATVAVLACGLDIAYPRQHAELMDQIASTGAVISEYAPGTPAQPFRFPERNRIVAALARGVLVVEAAIQSGSLVTARLALECGREVFAIPGSIHAPLSRGCHALIRQGAKLVEQGSDIEEELLRSGPPPQRSSIASRPVAVPELRGRNLGTHYGRYTPAPGEGAPAHATAAPSRPANRLLKDPTVGRVLQALGYDPSDIDQLCQRSGLAFPKVAAILTELELNDIVHRLEDGRFQRRQAELL